MIGQFKAEMLSIIDKADGKFNADLVRAGVRMIIMGIGDDPTRDGVQETPDRVAAMYKQILNGYEELPDIDAHLKLFKEPDAGMVIVSNVPFYSFCEHHMIPFVGHLSIAYLPADDKVLGLSKLVRVARLFAKQLQVQERMTKQIGEAIDKHCPNKGVAVRIVAEHMCMSIRGIRTPGAQTTTTHFTGQFKEDEKIRNEFLEAL